MIFAPFLAGTGGVEIAHGHILEPGVGTVIRKDLFEPELGFSVRVDRFLPVIFGDGHHLRLSVRSRGGGKNQLVHTVAHHRVQKVDAAADIRRIKRAGLTNRLRHQRFAGKMHHRMNLLRGEHFLDLLAVSQICLDEQGGGVHGGPMAFLKIIQGNYAMAAFEQHLRTDASDVSGASGHKNIQRKSSASGDRTTTLEYTVNADGNAGKNPSENSNAALQLSSQKSKSAEQVLYLLCGTFTYKLCASNVFPVRMFQQFPPVRSPDSVKLICRFDYPSSSCFEKLHPHRVAVATQRMAVSHPSFRTKFSGARRQHHWRTCFPAPHTDHARSLGADVFRK